MQRIPRVQQAPDTDTPMADQAEAAPPNGKGGKGKGGKGDGDGKGGRKGGKGYYGGRAYDERFQRPKGALIGELDALRQRESELQQQLAPQRSLAVHQPAHGQQQQPPQPPPTQTYVPQPTQQPQEILKTYPEQQQQQSQQPQQPQQPPQPQPQPQP